METRELFWSLGKAEIAGFYVLGLLAITAFFYGVWKHFEKYRKASPNPESFCWSAAISRLFADLITHRTIVRRDRAAGLAHGAIFAGFLIAFVGTTIITIDHDLVQPLFGFSFWRGKFYLLFSLFLDLGGLALLIGLCAMAFRRWVKRPAKLEYARKYRGEVQEGKAQAAWRKEDIVFLIVLIVITASGFLLEALRLYTDRPEWAIWSPVGYSIAWLYGVFGLDPDFAAKLRLWGWWSHGILSLAFIAAVPWYKAKHIISVLGSLLLREERPLSRLPSEPDDADATGVGKLSDFTLKDMLDFDACTKCGRCQEVCPATASGYPLSPRDLILDLRTANKNAAAGATPITAVIDDETLWACRSCGACQEICPVGVEHPSKIVRMRRALVDEGRMDPMLQTALSALGDVGNSFGEPERKRSAWIEELEFPVKDIRKDAAEYLWFVGDYASFDPRNQKVSRTFARLMRAAKVDFAVLHEGEHSAGNDVRRVGEEGLFTMLAEHNLAQFADAHPFDRIITTDPHSYNTIRNEYPEFQDVAEIEHYSTVLAQLLRGGKLKVTKPLNRKVTFHDPCHLGRLNGGYDAPREVLELIGCEIVEMPRNRDNSFCCGAGGGRIWMPDQPGEKPSENRVHEAATLNDVEVFVTCCPKDLNMFEDANKTADHAGFFSVEDLAELVADAVELDKLKPEDMPAVVKAIIEKSSELITQRVLDQLHKQAQLVPPAPELSAPSALAAESAPQSGPEQLIAPSPPPAPSQNPEAEPEAAAAESETDEASRQVKSLRQMTWSAPSSVTPADLAPYEMPERGRHKILVAIRHAVVLNDGFQIQGERSISSDSFDFRINEWDEAAMEEALLLSEKIGQCEVVAVTIGSEDAEKSLRKAMAMGADRGVRIWDERLAEADPITIARGLAGVAKHEQPDLFLCGVQSSDLGNGSTGIALAGILGVPHSAAVVACDWEGGDSISLTRELEGGTLQKFSMPTPAVLTIQTGANQPRYATMRMIKQARKKPLVLLDGSELDDGSSGHVVQRIYVPETEQATMLEYDAAQLADFIVDKINETNGG